MSVRNMRLRIRPTFVCTLAMLLAASQIAVAQVPVSTGKGRKLAPGVLQVIEPAAVRGETAEGPVDLPLVALNPDLDWEPNYDPKSEIVLENAKQVTFRKEVHCLQFAFKPVRMIEVNGKNRLVLALSCSLPWWRPEARS